MDFIRVQNIPYKLPGLSRNAPLVSNRLQIVSHGIFSLIVSPGFKVERGCLCLQKTRPLDLMTQGNLSHLKEEKLPPENKTHHPANRNSQNRQRKPKLSKAESGPLEDWCPDKSLLPPLAICSVVRRVVIPWGRLLVTLQWFLLEH